MTHPRWFTIAAIACWAAAGCIKSTDEDVDPNANDLIGTSGSALTKGSAGADNGDSDFCNNPANQCIWGEGDCDNNAQCFDPRGASVCAKDVGARFGNFSNFDYCVASHCTNKLQDAARGEQGVDCGGPCGPCTCPTNVPGGECTPSCRCAAGAGDCDTRLDCVPGARCVESGLTDLCQSGAELAFGRPAAQTSEFPGYPADLAVDGDADDFTHTGSFDTSSTWQVDLGSPQLIQEVWLQNRRECCGSRFRDLTVTIINGLADVTDFSAGTVVWTSALLNPENTLGERNEGIGPSELRVVVPNRTGRFVRISRAYDDDLSGTDGFGNQDEFGALSLAEVSVYGP